MSQTKWIIVIIILVFALTGIFVYFYFKNKQIKTSTSASPTAQVSSPTRFPSPVPSQSPSPATTKVKIFMIAPDDNGVLGKKIGCGDSAVAVTREVPETQAVLKAAMEQLISIKDKNYGETGLYNALYNSSLNLESASIENGRATVKFSGTLNLVGTCEDARIEAQFQETALQFSTVQSADIFINDQNLHDLISQEGP